MKNRRRLRHLGLVGVRLTVGLAMLGVAWAAQPAETKHPSGENQSDKTASRDNHANDSRANRNLDRNGASTPPVRQSAPSPRVVRQEPPRVLAVDHSVNAKRQSPPVSSAQRSKSPDTRSWLAGGDNKGKDDKGGADKGKGDKGGGSATPPPHREIQLDTPKPPRQDAGANSAGRKPPPPPADTGNRSKVSDVYKRLDNKNKNGVSGRGSAGQDHRGDTGRKLDGGTSADKKTGPPPLQDKKKMRSADQLKAGDFDRLSAGETAKKIKLADQYRMSQQGDVARRLDLQKHAGDFAHVNHAANAERFRHGLDADHGYQHHPNFYHGVVSPAYERLCLQYHYWGPSFFAGVCWYPRWNPWVEWSWHHHCSAFWDPRPIWCRPVVYDPCPPWVYWETPVYVVLPVVSCGTWVDLRPPIVAAAESDLQLVAVRFVDPGHPEEKLGPRYRVWFRNNGSQPILHPFNVVLFAANGDRLTTDLPQAGVRVTAMEANDIQSVDIRLPIEVYTMGRDAAGRPAPLSTLHVLVDANREVPEIVRTNNGARLIPAEILPVDPAAFELQPIVAKSGAEVLLAGEGFGPEPGQVLLHVGGKELQGEILGWYDLGVRWTLPNLTLVTPIEAEVIVIRGDGAAANPLKITIVP